MQHAPNFTEIEKIWWGMSDEQPPVLHLLNEVTNVHKVFYLIIFCWLLCGNVSWAGLKKKCKVQ